MSKTRIHELAKELNVSTKDLIDSAHSLGYDVKNHMSALEDQEIKQIKGRFMKKAPDNIENKAESTENKVKEQKVASTTTTTTTTTTFDICYYDTSTTATITITTTTTTISIRSTTTTTTTTATS